MVNNYSEYPNVIYEICFFGRNRSILNSMCGVLLAIQLTVTGRGDALFTGEYAVEGAVAGEA